jgi:hypothetical protein
MWNWLQDFLRAEHLIDYIEPLIRDNQGGLELKLERETLIEAWEFLTGVSRPNTLFSEDRAKPKPKTSSFTAKRDFSEPPPPTFVLPTSCNGSLTTGFVVVSQVCNTFLGYPLRLKKWTRRQADLLEKHSVRCITYPFEVCTRGDVCLLSF